MGQYARLGRIHVLTVAVAAAYALQTGALALELAHLAVFSRDGKGLQWRHTFFAADFAAEVMQGVSELITSLLLLFLARGWSVHRVSFLRALFFRRRSRRRSIRWRLFFLCFVCVDDESHTRISRASEGFMLQTEVFVYVYIRGHRSGAMARG